MCKVSKGLAGVMICLFAVGALSGCTNWKKKYQALEVDNASLKGQLERERNEKATMAQQLADMQKQQAAGQNTTGFQGDVKIDPKAGTITVTLPDTVLFDSGKADLKKSSIRELDQIISTLKSRSEYAARNIDIVGHTDSDPISKSNWKDNWQLSAERALSVLRYMSARGIDSDRLRAVGCGQSQPVVPNTSASNKAKNRRVEVVVHMTP